MSLAAGGVGSRGLVHYVITTHGVVQRHYQPEVQPGRIVIEISPLKFRQQINQGSEPAQRWQRPPAETTEAAR